MRRSELLALRWQNLDLYGTEPKGVQLTVVETLHELHNGEYVLDAPKTTQSKRTIPLGPSLAIELREHKARQAAIREKLGSKLEETDLVFSSPDGRPLHPGSVTHAFGKAATAAGFPDLCLHGLRHTHATIMLQQGYDVKVVGKRLGHADITTTLAYHHPPASMEREAANGFDELMQSAGRKSDTGAGALISDSNSGLVGEQKESNAGHYARRNV
jgi:integrase